MKPIVEYPLNAIKSAAQEVGGRVLLYFLSVLSGAWIGISIEINRVAGLETLLSALFLGSFISIFTGGFIFLGLILIFAFIFSRFDIPLWTLVFPLLGSLLFYSQIASLYSQ